MKLLSTLLGGICLFLLFFLLGAATLHHLVSGAFQSNPPALTASHRPPGPSAESLVEVDVPSPPAHQSAPPSSTPPADLSERPAQEDKHPSFSAILILEDGLPPGAITVYQDGESLWWQHGGLLKPLHPHRFRMLLKGRYYLDLGPLSPEDARRRSLPLSAHMLLVLTQSDSRRISTLLQAHTQATERPAVIAIRYARAHGFSIVTGVPSRLEQKGGFHERDER